MSEKLRLGIVGCGNMASGHVACFTGLEKRMDVTITADIEIERAEKLASHFDKARAVSDYSTIMDEVDAVLIVLPHHLHYTAAAEFLKAGKHVLVEKPMVNSEEEGVDLVRISDESDSILMVGYCMRFDPAVTEMKKLLDAKKYGDCFQLSIWTEQLTKIAPDIWKSSASTLGGGQLFSHGCHYIDLLMWMMGNPVTGIHLGTNFGTPWMEKEGTSNVTMGFESGALGYHFGTWGALGTRLRYSFHAHCTEGMLEFRLSSDGFEGEKLFFHRDGKEELLFEGVMVKPTRNEMEHFLNCIESGSEPLTNARDSLDGLRVIWRMYEAEEKGVIADLTGLSVKP